jgi:hypothetical protein
MPARLSLDGTNGVNEIEAVLATQAMPGHSNNTLTNYLLG